MNDNELAEYQGQLVRVTYANGTPYCAVGRVQGITPESIILFPATNEYKDIDEKARRRLRRIFSTDGWTGDAAFQNAFDDGHHKVKREDLAGIERLVL